MAPPVLVLIAVIILADLIVITLLLLRAGRTWQKIETLCDTFEKTIHNALENTTSNMEEMHKRLTEAEGHLRTMNKNIYIMAKQIIGHEEAE